MFLQIPLLMNSTTSLFRSKRMVTRHLRYRFLLFRTRVLVIASRLLIRLSRNRIQSLRFHFSRFNGNTPNMRMNQRYHQYAIRTSANLRLLVIPIRGFRRNRLRTHIALRRIPSHNNVRVLFPFRRKVRNQICNGRRPLCFFVNLRHFPTLTVRSTLAHIP